jgi:hypothetical protein
VDQRIDDRQLSRIRRQPDRFRAENFGVTTTHPQATVPHQRASPSSPNTIFSLTLVRLHITMAPNLLRSPGTPELTTTNATCDAMSDAVEGE